MNSGPSSVVDEYKALIRAEIKSIHAKPLSHDATKLLHILDEFELDPRVNIQDYDDYFAAVHLLAHIVNLDITNAKFLVKRLDENIKKSERIQSILVLIKLLLQKRYADVMIAARSAEGFLSGNDATKALIEACIPILRSCVLRFLTKNFDTLQRSVLAKYLSLKDEEASEYLVNNGWKVSDHPDFMKAPEKVEISDREFKEITEAEFKNLSQTISFLETI